MTKEIDECPYHFGVKVDTFKDWSREDEIKYRATMDAHLGRAPEIQSENYSDLQALYDETYRNEVMSQRPE